MCTPPRCFRFFLAIMGKRKWGDWTEHYHDKKKKYYYYNSKTKQSTFTRPEGFSANAVDPDAPAKKKKRTATPAATPATTPATWQKCYSKSKVSQCINLFIISMLVFLVLMLESGGLVGGCLALDAICLIKCRAEKNVLVQPQNQAICV